MILIILVQRPQGGGLASAFGGAGGGGTDTVFGGRVGDALTIMTVVAFILFLGLAVALNLVDSSALTANTSALDTTTLVTPDTTVDPTSAPSPADHPTNTQSKPDHPTNNSDHPTNGPR